MAFIISKNSKKWGKDRKVYYLVENYRDKGKVKRRTLLKLHEEGSIEVILEKLTINEKTLKENLKAYENKLLEIEKNKDDPKYFFAKLGIDSKIRNEEARLNDVVSTKKGIEKILKKHPMSSARNSNIN